MSYGTEKTIFAEQDASVNITDCSIMAGFKSAVSILGCHAFLANTRFYGADYVELQVLDIDRPSGLKVELGSIVTARQCHAEYLYFGFSVIAHSVAHFDGCHAEHVVYGYTINASVVTIENSSAYTSHVGVLVLNKAKCVINNEASHTLPLEEQCRLLLKLREDTERWQQQQQQQQSEQSCSVEDANGTDAHFSALNNFASPAELPALPGGNKEEEKEKDANLSSRKTSFSFDIMEKSTMLPISFRGGVFGMEVYGAILEVKSVVLADAQETSICVYNEASLSLTDVLVWAASMSLSRSCGVKIVNSQARVRRCLVLDYKFCFAVLQGSTVNFEESMAVGGINGFTIDSAQCVLYHCGADTRHVGVFALNQSRLRMDNNNAPKLILGSLPCVLRGRFHGLESCSSDTTCVGVRVQRGLDSGFTCHNGGSLRLEKCIVEMSHATLSEPVALETSHRSASSLRMTQSSSTSGVVVASFSALDSSKRGKRRDADASTNSQGEFSCLVPSLVYSSQKNSGVKAWSGSRCIAIGCEVRNVTFGYAAIGPKTEFEAFRCMAKHIVNGFTVDGAKCRLSRCSTNSNHVGVFVLTHGTCTVRRGNYTARVYGIENCGGIVNLEGHVKLGGFSRIGLYVYDNGRLETAVDSTLSIRVCKGSAQQHPPLQPVLSGVSTGSLGSFPTCFGMDSGTAVIHHAFLGGGAHCAVSCGDGATVFLNHCTAEFCNVAFNAFAGSHIRLLNCCTQHIWQHTLVVHCGAEARIYSHSRIPSEKQSMLQGRLRIEGRCVVEHAVLQPLPYEDAEQTIPVSSEPLTAQESTSGVPPVAMSFWPKASTRTSYSQSNGLISVTGVGKLVMESCLVLLDERQCVPVRKGQDEDTSTQFVISAEGRGVTVQLRNVIFQRTQALCDGDKNGASSPGNWRGQSSLLADTPNCRQSLLGGVEWYTLSLLQGAQGEVTGSLDALHLDKNIFLMCATAIRHPLQALSEERHTLPFFCLPGGDGTSAAVAISNGLAGDESCSHSVTGDLGKLLGGEVLPFKIHVAHASFLKVQNLNVRHLFVSDGSRISASHCSFAGANAVVLTRGGIFDAVESVFVGAVRGPAMRVEHATVSLNKCRGYFTLGKIIEAKHATLRMRDCTFDVLNLVNDITCGEKSSLREDSWLCVSHDKSKLKRRQEDGKAVKFFVCEPNNDKSHDTGTVEVSCTQKDVGVPKMSVSVCYSLRGSGTGQEEVTPPIPFLFLSAFTDNTRCNAVTQSAQHDSTGAVELNSHAGEDTASLLRPTPADVVVETKNGRSLESPPFCSMRLEHSTLWRCRATHVGGSIEADDSSRLEISHAPWSLFLGSVLATVSVGICAAWVCKRK